MNPKTVWAPGLVIAAAMLASGCAGNVSASPDSINVQQVEFVQQIDQDEGLFAAAFRLRNTSGIDLELSRPVLNNGPAVPLQAVGFVFPESEDVTQSVIATTPVSSVDVKVGSSVLLVAIWELQCPAVENELETNISITALTDDNAQREVTVGVSGADGSAVGDWAEEIWIRACTESTPQ